MTDVAVRFTQRVMLRQALVGLATFLALAIFAPKLIVLEWDVALSVFTVGVTLAALAIVTVAVTSFLTLREHRFVVRTLALGGAAVEPEDIARLAELPNKLTVRYFALTSIFTAVVLVPGFRPEKLDDGRAVSLLILAITIFAASAIPHYVLTRQATTELIELAPLEPLSQLLESEEDRQISIKRVIRRLLFAVVVPVALVGVGAVLVAHAHLRTLTEQTRRQTALVIARTVLEPGAARDPDASRQEAIAAAERLGFHAKVEKNAEKTDVTVTRQAEGEIAVSASVDDGQAEVRFSSELDPANTSAGAAVALLAVLIAAALGSMFGRALAKDLVLATRSVRMIGTENIMRGQTRIAKPARFATVANLGRAIEVLTDRFRIFAAAQERALNAREAAQRMRGLLFASVSHDLKSPLNAILGFAELLDREPLSAAQRESLELIVKRGKELLALIETILDAARVEAGQLTLIQRQLDVPTLIGEAVKKARELASDVDFPVNAAIDDGVPMLPVDRAYATRAIAVIVAHACRVSQQSPSSGAVEVRAVSERGGVRVDVEYASREVSRAELDALFARQATQRGQGLTLGLSLARSVIELHGGKVEAFGSPDGAPLARITFPLAKPDRRPQLTSFPALG